MELAAVQEEKVLKPYIATLCLTLMHDHTYQKYTGNTQVRGHLDSLELLVPVASAIEGFHSIALWL